MDEQQRILQIFQSYREVNQAFYQVMKKVAQQYELTPHHLMVLRILTETPEIKLTELSDKLRLGNSTTSGIVDRMVAAGLISRERTESDRRAMTLKVTDKGAAVWEQSNTTKTLLFQPLLKLPVEDLLQFFRIQKEIIQILQNVKEDDIHDQYGE